MFLPAAIANILPPPVAAVVVAVAAPPAVSAGSSLTPAQRMPPPGPPSAPAGGARRRPAARTRAVPQGGVPSNFASPDLPGASCSTSSPNTPRLSSRLQPVALRFTAEAAPGDDETDGGSEGVRDRGSRGDERRGGEDPEGGEGEGEGGRD